MDFFYLLVALALALLLSGMLAIRRVWRLRTLLPYRFDGALLDPAERRLLPALDAALGSGYRVFVRVPVEDVIALAPRLAKPLRERAVARLAERRFDFLVCDSASLRVCAAIALRDAGSGYRRSAPDKTLGRVCRAAGLPLLNIPARERYEPGELVGILREVIIAEPRSESDRARQLASGAGARANGEVSGQDEERLLTQLAAAIRDDGLPAAEPSAGRQGGALRVS